MLDPFDGVKSFVFISEVTGKRYDMGVAEGLRFGE